MIFIGIIKVHPKDAEITSVTHGAKSSRVSDAIKSLFNYGTWSCPLGDITCDVVSSFTDTK